MWTALRALWREYLEICAASWVSANLTTPLPPVSGEVATWGAEAERLHRNGDASPCGIAASVAGLVVAHVADVYHDAAHVSASHWGLHRLAQRQ